MKTRDRLTPSRVALVAVLILPPILLAQSARQTRADKSPGVQSGQPNSNARAHVNLSGIWTTGGTFSLSPKGGTMDAGTPADGVPYQPWALEKFKQQRTGAGPNATFDNPTDAVMNLCDPQPAPRIYTWPSKFKFIQTSDVVYMLFEYGPFWRPILLNRKHPDPDELDNTWWGHAIGWYEGSDTFVIDTVGFNDKTWLDRVGRVHSDKLHLVERFRRVDADTMEISITIDDPGAYKAPWTWGPTVVKQSRQVQEYGLYPWICSQEENQKFNKDVLDPTLTP